MALSTRGIDGRTPLPTPVPSPAPARSTSRSFADVLTGPVAAVAGIAGGPLAAVGVSAVGALASHLLGGPGVGLEAEQSSLADAEQLQAQGQEMNLQYLALQEQIQASDRSFETLSNVLRSQHDTAKAAIANIRS